MTTADKWCRVMIALKGLISTSGLHAESGQGRGVLVPVRRGSLGQPWGLTFGYLNENEELPGEITPVEAWRLYGGSGDFGTWLECYG